MEQSTRVYFCCSPNKRSGSTTTARLLIDYFLSRGRGAVGFDTDPHDPDFARRFPSAVKVVDTAKIYGQIDMFDRLLVPDETPKVVDVHHRRYDSLFDTIGQIGFMEEAQSAMVQPVALFHVDASPDSLNAASALVKRWPSLRLVVVRNKGAAPRGPDARDILDQFPHAERLSIGAVDWPTWKAFDAPDFSLPEILKTPPANLSIGALIGLRAWVTPIFRQFQLFEMGLSMENSRFL
ncbi:MAG: hypothetical protein ABR929_03970 [Roseiarcus sp.]|jgi:hypothetical protein